VDSAAHRAPEIDSRRARVLRYMDINCYING
jgi:hypothetical protein